MHIELLTTALSLGWSIDLGVRVWKKYHDKPVVSTAQAIELKIKTFEQEISGYGRTANRETRRLMDILRGV